MTSPVACYDFRLNAVGLSETTIVESLRRIAKYWVFQEEEGDSGYLHYQGRFSLIKKRRKPELMKLWTELGLTMPLPNYLEPTTNVEKKATSFSYVMKEDTRKRGPWSDQEDEVYIPRQYRGKLDTLYPYQKVIFDSAKEFDGRIINLIYCPHGNKGKSTIASLCELYGKGIDLPPVNDADKLIASACDICMAKKVRDPSPIFVDLPRAMDKSRLYGIFTAIEVIKKGKLFDLRHHYKQWWIDSPAVWVFMNTRPELNYLSKDRWCVWTINDAYELVPYVGEEDLID